ncbi:MAG: acetylornithine/succinylornithine family transaminase [Clostridiales Family XIII bacterium]|jgi:acetylornithine/N-succinyldiaminopimelate aminotransferase|nr:acetylornithine/succinylornithine family transaminase [Clostridiales Family XIII bacterium]
MDFNTIKNVTDTYTAHTYARYDVAITSGRGAHAFGPDGKEYIDFTSGIGVNILGFSDPGWAAAVSEQAAKLQHSSNLFYSEPCAVCARRMAELSGMANMFFCNSGAEANEGAIKTARKYSLMKYASPGSAHDFNRFEIITLDGSFHGRTMATITATGQESFHNKNFSPFLQGFAYARPNDIASLHEKISDKTCAIMIEFVQGVGGVNVLDAEYVAEIARVCAERDILFIADEVQTGVARTGKFMAYEHFGIRPDIVTVAKGLGGGLPLGGILFGEKTKDTLQPGDHGSTYGGNPVVCAGASYVLSRIDEDFLAEVRRKSAVFTERLLSLPGVTGLSGIGLMLGVALRAGNAKQVVDACREKGLLVLTAGERIRFLPPLVITDAEIAAGLDIFAEVLAERE